MDLTVFIAIGLFVLPVALICVLAYGTRNILQSSRSRGQKALRILGLAVLLSVAGLFAVKLLLLPFASFH